MYYVQSQTHTHPPLTLMHTHTHTHTRSHSLTVNGEWDFYVFGGEAGDIGDEIAQATSSSQDERSSESHQDQINRENLDFYLHQELLLRYGLDIDGLSGSLPLPPPRPPIETSSGPPEEEKKPTFEVIPFVKRTTVTLNFARKTLEEFMDR